VRKPNYQFEKRKRELEKKKKKAEKADRRVSSPADSPETDSSTAAPSVEAEVLPENK
jgi:hypothetical protein